MDRAKGAFFALVALPRINNLRAVNIVISSTPPPPPLQRIEKRRDPENGAARRLPGVRRLGIWHQ
jgi:hypothetical protein